jgi:hypothetical protein
MPCAVSDFQIMPPGRWTLPLPQRRRDALHRLPHAPRGHGQIQCYRGRMCRSPTRSVWVMALWLQLAGTNWRLGGRRCAAAIRGASEGRPDHSSGAADAKIARIKPAAAPGSCRREETGQATKI